MGALRELAPHWVAAGRGCLGVTEAWDETER